MTTVLLIDEMEIMRTGMTVLIKDCYPEAVFFQAGSAEEALKLLKSHEFGLLVCSEKLARKNDCALAGAARSLQKDARILLLHQHRALLSFGKRNKSDKLIDKYIDLRSPAEEVRAILAALEINVALPV